MRHDPTLDRLNSLEVLEAKLIPASYNLGVSVGLGVFSTFSSSGLDDNDPPPEPEPAPPPYPGDDPPIDYPILPPVGPGGTGS
jgi:hypothetical protein